MHLNSSVTILLQRRSFCHCQQLCDSIPIPCHHSNPRCLFDFDCEFRPFLEKE